VRVYETFFTPPLSSELEEDEEEEEEEELEEDLDFDFFFGKKESENG